MDSNNHTDAILEAIKGQLSAILEGQEAMSRVPSDIQKLKEDISEIKDDVHAIKTAVTDQSKQLDTHDTRLSKLEQATT